VTAHTHRHTDTAWRHRPRLHSIARQKVASLFSLPYIYILQCMSETLLFLLCTYKMRLKTYSDEYCSPSAISWSNQILLTKYFTIMYKACLRWPETLHFYTECVLAAPSDIITFLFDSFCHTVFFETQCGFCYTVLFLFRSWTEFMNVSVLSVFSTLLFWKIWKIKNTIINTFTSLKTP